MPIYEWACPNCGREIERIHQTAPETVYDAPRCERCGVHMTRRPSAPSFTVGGYNAKNGYSK